MHIAGCDELMTRVEAYVATTLASTIAKHQARPIVMPREPCAQVTSGDSALIVQAASVADAFGEAVIQLAARLEIQEVCLYTTIQGQLQ